MAALPAVDLFAGAGGLSIGLAAAGFEMVAAVETNPDACDTYRANHPAAKVFEQDVATVELRPLRGQVALLAGGPPCQPFSVGGKRLAADDPRNGIPQFVRAVAETRPAAFVMENVAGLASRAAYLASVLGELDRLGYHVSWQVLQAAGFGVAQQRRRLFVIGTLRGGFQFRGGDHPTVPSGAVIDPAKPLGTPNASVVTYARNPSLRPGPYHGHLWNGGGRPIDLARPAPTLLASMGGNKTPWVDTMGLVPGYHAHLAGGGAPRSGQVPGARRITVEEAALLQGFRPGTAFAGPRSSQYRQIGNAVPPPLAEAVGRQLVSHLSARRRRGQGQALAGQGDQ